MFDPRVFAVRADLADVRLADRVFAPHYAAPLRRMLSIAAPLRANRGGDVLATLDAGEAFDLLDVTGGIGWGIAVGRDLVGYVDEAILEPAA